MIQKNYSNHSFNPVSAADLCVVISSYNRKVYLKRAISSVLSQSCQPSQILLVDDGSTDGSPAYLQETFPQIELLSYKINRGPAYARNFAVNHTDKKWIAFLDSDDAWTPSKLQFQLEKMSASPSLFSATKETWIRNDRIVHPPQTHQIHPDASVQQIFIRSLQRCIIATSTVLMNRDFFQKLGGFNENLPICEDFELWLRCLTAESFCYLPQELTIKYGGRPDQVSSQFKRLQPYQMKALFAIWQTKNQIPASYGILVQNALVAIALRELENANRHGEISYAQQCKEILTTMELDHSI